MVVPGVDAGKVVQGGVFSGQVGTLVGEISPRSTLPAGWFEPIKDLKIRFMRNGDRAGTAAALHLRMRFASFVVLVVMAAAGGCSGRLDVTGGNSAVAADSSPGAAAVFRPGIQQDLDAAGCSAVACHGGTSVPMPLVANPISDDDWRDNYNQVKARAGTVSASLLMEKATGAGSHVPSLSADDPMMSRWREWIELGAPYQNATGGDGDAGAESPDAGPAGDAGQALTWEDDIRPLLNGQGCLDCHGSSGAYSLESYSAALGFGSDSTPNVIPGDPLSLLIIYCEQGHEGMTAEATLDVIGWVVDWQARER